jgi:SAM-dependent methyltransferase
VLRTIEDFRRGYLAGEYSLERWEECSISPATLDPFDADPHSPAYAAAVLDTWRRITGRQRYDAAADESFSLDDRDFLGTPYPYSSSNPVEVANYFGAVAAAVARIGADPPARVLELGAGWGHLAMALAATGFRVTAVDLNGPSVELLRRRAAALHVDLDVVQSTFLDYRADEPVDAIVFFEAFHHCEKPFELLDRCVDALAPRGRLLFVADAIYDDFYAPWGVRLDGSAAFMAAQQGWLELGFRRDFFEAELVARGLTPTWEVLPWLAAYGTVLVAARDRRT